MEELPDPLTPIQLQAHALLTHLLTTLQSPHSKYHTRYSRWLARHKHLPDFCLRYVRPQVWQALDRGLSYDSIKSIAGDFVWQTRGVYFSLLLGQTDHLPRLYIGQSRNLRVRIRQHTDFRYRRDNPSLHYHALQKSKANAYGTLCVLPSPSMGNHALPGMDEPELLLNVLEMWMCLVFRCLPEGTLEEWLPEGEGRGGEVRGLNIQCPLGNGEGGRREWVDLRGAEDWIVREWVETKRVEWEGEKVVGEKGAEEEGVEKRGAGTKMSGVGPPVLMAFCVGMLVGVQLSRVTRR